MNHQGPVCLVRKSSACAEDAGGPSPVKENEFISILLHCIAFHPAKVYCVPMTGRTIRFRNSACTERVS